MPVTAGRASRSISIRCGLDDGSFLLALAVSREDCGHLTLDCRDKAVVLRRVERLHLTLGIAGSGELLRPETLKTIAGWLATQNSPVAGIIPRDHRNPIPLRTEGNLASGRQSQQLLYAFRPNSCNLQGRDSLFVPGEPDWNRQTRSIKRKEEIVIYEEQNEG